MTYILGGNHIERWNKWGMKESYVVDNFRKENSHYEVNMEKHKNRCFNIFKKIQNGDRIYVSADDVSKKNQRK